MEPNPQPPVRRPAKPNTGPAHEAEIDAALDAAMTKTPARPAADMPLKRQWDDDLESQLEAALAGFDPNTYEAGNARRTRFDDRAHVPQSERGQEGRSGGGSRLGKVIGIRGKTLFVDLGGKSEGIVPLEQFDQLKKDVPEKGAMLEVVIDRYDEDEGILKLNLKGAAVEADWANLHKGVIVEARVTKVNKGGLDVDVSGIRGFLPISQIDLNRVEDASVYLNQKLRVMVTEANERQRNLVVSRRELLMQEREELKAKTWAELEEGQVRHGVVRSLKDYGAFVDIGGVDGLLHVADLSWVRVKDIGSLVRVGQEVEVKVLKIDRETKKVGLGLKQLTTNPWDTADMRYARGQVVPGRVTRLMEFGAFVELEPGIEGLIHISELGNNRVRRVQDVVKPEQEVEVRILTIDTDARKISLTLRPQAPAATETEAEEAETAEEETPTTPKPERKVPLKGGLGDSDPNPFG